MDQVADLVAGQEDEDDVKELEVDQDSPGQ